MLVPRKRLKEKYQGRHARTRRCEQDQLPHNQSKMALINLAETRMPRGEELF